MFKEIIKSNNLLTQVIRFNKRLFLEKGGH